MADTSNQEGLTRSEVAKKFGVSVSTVRTWQREFQDQLEVKKQEYGGGRRQATRYSDADMLVFATVKKLADEGLRYADIHKRLDEELASATFELPEDASEDEKEEPGTSMVPWTQYSATVAKLQGVEGKLEAIESERDYLRERVDTMDTRHDKEREEWKEELDEMKQQLEEERQKSWWQKLRRK